MTACTGQPVLATNVTQAQAFCIATACLQVPVLRPVSAIGGRHLGELPNDVSTTTNKLNLFRPLLLFGASPNKWAPSYFRHQRLHNLIRLESLLRTRQLGAEMKPNEGATNESSSSSSFASQPEQTSELMAADSAAEATTVQSTPPGSSSSLAPATTKEQEKEKEREEAAAAATTEAPKGSRSTTLQPATSSSPIDPVATEESARRVTSMAFPDYGQIYAQIESLAGQQRRAAGASWPFKLRGQSILWQPMHDYAVKASKRQQQALYKLQLAADRVNDLLRSVSDGLAAKKSALLLGLPALLPSGRRWSLKTKQLPTRGSLGSVGDQQQQPLERQRSLALAA